MDKLNILIVEAINESAYGFDLSNEVDTLYKNEKLDATQWPVAFHTQISTNEDPFVAVYETEEMCKHIKRS